MSLGKPARRAGSLAVTRGALSPVAGGPVTFQ